MAGVGVIIDGSAELEDVVGDLDLLSGLFGDLRPLMDAIGQYGVSSTQRRFETETGPDGERWKPSARAIADGGKTLTDSAQLLGSMTHNVLGNDGVEWGTNKIYGPIHQFGGVIRAKDAPRLRFRIPGVGWRTAEEVFMPARPFLGIDEEDQEKIGEITGIIVEEALA